MKFIHLADLHLGRFYKGELPPDIAKIRREELWENFTKTIKICNEKNIDILLISGDIYEKDFFTLNEMRRFASLLNSLKYTNTFIIAGNHDYIDKESLYNKVEFNEKVHIFKEETHFDLENMKLRVSGISWTSNEAPKTDYKFPIKEDFKNIIMLHGTVDGNNYMPLELEKLKNIKADYIALGHIHKREKLAENICYCGSPEGLNFKETGRHGFIYGDLENDKISFVENEIRKYNQFTIDITDKTTVDVKTEIEEKIANHRRDLNRFHIIGKSKDSKYIMEVVKLISDGFYNEFSDETEDSLDINEIYMNGNSLVKKFIEEMKNDEKALKIGLNALMEAKSNEN